MDRRKEVWSRCCSGAVPNQTLEKIFHEYLTEDQRTRACADYYINRHPKSSWKHLHWGLFYYSNEVAAVRKARTFIPQTGEFYINFKYKSGARFTGVIIGALIIIEHLNSYQ